MADTPALPFGRIEQVCVVVRDLRRAMAQYWRLVGIGPWRVYTYGAPRLQEMTYRGRPADFRFKGALAQAGSLVFELIEPERGPTIYHEFLEQHGEGLQHVGVYVPSIDEAIAQAHAAGLEVIQSGRGYGVHGDGAFAYLGTTGGLGAVFEVIEVPAERYPPDEVYPPES